VTLDFLLDVHLLDEQPVSDAVRIGRLPLEQLRAEIE